MKKEESIQEKLVEKYKQQQLQKQEQHVKEMQQMKEIQQIREMKAKARHTTDLGQLKKQYELLKMQGLSGEKSPEKAAKPESEAAEGEEAKRKAKEKMIQMDPNLRDLLNEQNQIMKQSNDLEAQIADINKKQDELQEDS